MARGQYKGNRSALEQLKLRKMASKITTPEMLGVILSQMRPEARDAGLALIRPYLPFKLESQAQ